MTRKCVLAVGLVMLALLGGCARPKLVTRAPGASGAICLRNARVFDAPRATLVDGLRDVLVRDGTIAAVGRSGMNVSGVAEMDCQGVTILAGSDSPNIGHFPGASLHVELHDLVEAGMTPGEALRAATVDAARFLAADAADFGEIAPGKRADLLLVDGDPTASLDAVDRIRAVFLGGVKLERRARSRID
jgi:imidazolonepropionase-like amidohydrolase